MAVRSKIRVHEVEMPAEPPRHVLRAFLGPTNTGKTHNAIERMLAFPTGIIGLPLRLLAREVYDRLVTRCPPGAVALVTGEEKIVPPSPAYWVATVEAMPLDLPVDFVAVDEIQLATDPERGRIFTSRALHARGARETLLLGSDSMRAILRALFPKIEIEEMARFSSLSYAGAKKVSRTPRRTAIVGFSTDTVYSIAELIRRQRGGAAVILGALSPRTRNAQAALYQSGEVEHLVATDAIGMGLNMDIDHVAFAARRKFDGRFFRDLTPQELAQIAGRAGRHVRDGTFGVTADCPPLEDAVIDAIETHSFEPVTVLQWRSDALEFSSLEALKRSLEAPSARIELQRARESEDEQAMRLLTASAEVCDRISCRADVELLWEICQTPDFRKASFDQHVRLLGELFDQLGEGGRISSAWIEPKIAQLARFDGEIDAISTRLAYIRTWTYLANRARWLDDAAYWQGKTRELEDTLSDALHEKLTQRFVDRRTSVLLKKLRDDVPLLAGVTEDGDVIVEGQFVGRLMGFEFEIDPRAKGADARRVRGAAERALTPVLAARAAALANSQESELTLKDDGAIWWRSSMIAELRRGPAMLRPDIAIRGLDALSPSLRGRVADRLRDYVAARIEILLGPLLALKRAADATGENALAGNARGVAFRIAENFGAMSRSQFGEELKALGQDERAKLRQLGLKFGEYTLHMPALLKPSAARLMVLLWSLWAENKAPSAPLPKPGLVSFPLSKDAPHAFYYALGYRPSGDRAIRIDMLERFAQLIRTARADATAREGFVATSQMMSLVGCSGEEFESVLRSIGYRKATVKRAPATLAAPAAAGDATSPAEAPTELMEAPADAPEALAAQEIEPIAVEAASTPAVESAAPAESASAEAAPAAESAALEEIVVWRLAPRSAPPRRNNRRPAPEQGAAAPATEQNGERNNRRRREGGGGHRPPAQGDGPKRDQSGEGRPRFPKRGKDDKRPGKGGDRAEPRRYSSEPRHNHREPDPNSPFAVLAALKATLPGNGGATE